MHCRTRKSRNIVTTNVELSAPSVLQNISVQQKQNAVRKCQHCTQNTTNRLAKNGGLNVGMSGLCSRKRKSADVGIAPRKRPDWSERQKRQGKKQI